MAQDLKPEASVPARVPQRPCRWAPNGQPTKDERPRVECELLALLFSRLADEFNGLDSFLLPLGGENFYTVFVRQLTHDGLHVLHTRVAGPVDLAIRGPERLQRLPSQDRVQSCVQLPPK